MSEKILLNKIKKHLQGHITEGNFDNLDIQQLKLIDKELKRIMPAKTKKGSGARGRPDKPDGYYDSMGFLKDSEQDKQFMNMNPSRRGQYSHIVNNRLVGTGIKGSKSKTHKGDLNYTTKKGDKYFHENGHLVKKTYKPFDAHKGSKSKTHAGLDYIKIPLRGGGMLSINIAHGSDSDSDSDMEGEGIIDDSWQQQILKNQLSTAIQNNKKIKLAQRGLYATTAIPKSGKLTFTDFAKGWARHHGITHGGALKSKAAKHHYKTINDHLIKEGKGWDDFIHGAQTFFTGGYNDQINQGIQNVGNQVKDAFDAFGNKISGTASQITQQIRDQADKVIADVNNGIKVGKDAIMNLANNAAVTANQKWDLIKAFVKDASNKVSEGVMTGVNFVKKYGETAINWLKDNKDAMKAIAISVAKFAVKKGIPLVGEQLGGILADALAAGMLQPELIPVAQTLGSMAGKKLGEMLSDYIMSLGLADAQGNPDADKWLAITGQAIDAAKMAYSGYQGLKSVGNYLSGASSAGSAAAGATATVGTGLITMRKRGRPRKIKSPFD